MEVGHNTFVRFAYRLNAENGAASQEAQEAQEKKEVQYIHGYGQIIPGLEAALAGKTAGEKFQTIIQPEEGYGNRDEDLVVTFPREKFSHIEDLEPGMELEARSDEGNAQFKVLKVDHDQVTVDANHHYAGVTLSFDIEIKEVREADEDEIQLIKKNV